MCVSTLPNEHEPRIGCNPPHLSPLMSRSADRCTASQPKLAHRCRRKAATSSGLIVGCLDMASCCRNRPYALNCVEFGAHPCAWLMACGDLPCASATTATAPRELWGVYSVSIPARSVTFFIHRAAWAAHGRSARARISRVRCRRIAGPDPLAGNRRCPRSKRCTGTGTDPSPVPLA